MSEYLKQKDKCFWKSCYIYKADFLQGCYKTFCGYDSYVGAFVNSRTAQIHDSVCQMISLLESI